MKRRETAGQWKPGRVKKWREGRGSYKKRQKKEQKVGGVGDQREIKGCIKSLD